METALSLVVGLSDSIDSLGILGGGRDHILAALVVGWVFYAVAGYRVTDPGLRFLAVSIAVAGALAVSAPIDLIFLASALYVATCLVELGRTRHVIAPQIRRRPSAVAAA